MLCSYNDGERVAPFPIETQTFVKGVAKPGNNEISNEQIQTNMAKDFDNTMKII